MLDVCLMKTEIHTVTAMKDVRTDNQLGGELAGKHDTLAGHRPPPKWYK